MRERGSKVRDQLTVLLPLNRTIRADLRRSAWPVENSLEQGKSKGGV